MTGKPRAETTRKGVCSECGDKVELVKRRTGPVIGFHHGNRQGIGSGCSGVGYEAKGEAKR